LVYYLEKGGVDICLSICQIWGAIFNIQASHVNENMNINISFYPQKVG